ncbi:MAG: site-2 protease family protein [Clostridia bacterium]|nr:site-2 protease family protein [Clostridia bacterium]
MNEMGAKILEYGCLIAAIVLSLSIHEFSHAWMATKLGDPTPRATGRISLNPIRHIDIFGFIVMIFAHFGWAKPVQVNPMYFRNPSKGMMYTALAGPISNIGLCLLFSPLYYLSSYFFLMNPAVEWIRYLQLFMGYMVMLNITLAVFNMIPIYPLDGSRVVGHYFPRYATFMARYADIVQLVFICLLILPDFVRGVPDIIGFLIGTVQGYVVSWLMMFWNLILGLFPIGWIQVLF